MSLRETSTEILVTYIGNEGVIVRGGGAEVAVDALFGDGAPEFSAAPPELVSQLEGALPPFDGVQLLLATHFHPDHFNALAVGSHMAANKNVLFLSSPQTRELFAAEYPEFHLLSDRVMEVYPEEGHPDVRSIGEAEVTSFRLSHGTVNYGDVQHLGFMVKLGGKRFVHLGDGIIHERALRAGGILDHEIDAAFLPFWFLTYAFGQSFMERHLRARQVFAMHIPLNRQEELAADVASFDPSAIPLLMPLQSHRV